MRFSTIGAALASALAALFSTASLAADNPSGPRLAAAAPAPPA